VPDVFAKMLDDYSSVLRHGGVSAAARMWADAPRATEDTRVDAAFRRNGRVPDMWTTRQKLRASAATP
jgi:hypothetical protein